MNPGLPRSPDEIRTASATSRRPCVGLARHADPGRAGTQGARSRHRRPERLPRGPACRGGQPRRIRPTARCTAPAARRISCECWKPRTATGSTPTRAPRARPGYPDAEIDTPWIGSDHYLGVAFKPGMGVDLSAERLCDYRCFGSIDTLNNHSTRCAPGTSSSPPARFSLSGTMTG